MFTITARDGESAARTGRLVLGRGEVPTPVFMPVGTCGSVKMLTPAQVEEAGAKMILANTYHLILRPGIETVERLGGLHAFAGWEGPILTDSGGFQVFSLARCTSVHDRGVTFRSHVDGRLVELGPHEAAEAQRRLGSDIAVALDVCPPASASRDEVENAVRRTVRWAEETRAYAEGKDDGPLFFAVSQGGRFTDLRERCTRALVDMDFPGYALGGLSVGESRALRREITAFTASLLPEEKPRYAMGIGEPEDILDAVERGCDMFDCVLPTRNGRNGTAFTYAGKVNIRNSRFRTAREPVEEGCTCYCCTRFSAGYVRHLFNTGEGLGPVLLSLHNLTFYMRFMEDIRRAVARGAFMEFKERFLERFDKGSRQ